MSQPLQHGNSTRLESTELTRGFILTRRCFDADNRNLVEYWLATDKGPVRLEVQNEKSVFFVEAANQQEAAEYLTADNIDFTSKTLDLKTFANEPVCGFYFDSNRSYFSAREILEEARIITFESTIRVEERFLMERFCYGSIEFIGDEYRRNGFSNYSNVRVRPYQFSPTLKVLSIDIECSEKGELFSIGFYGGSTDEPFELVLMIDPNKPTGTNQEFVRWVSDEKTLLQEFAVVLNQFDPDIIIGWNVVNFDFRVLIRRANLHHVQLRIGRGNTLLNWRESRQDRSQGYLFIGGRVVLDGIAALKSEAYNFPSFSLEAMALHFLGEGKETENVDNRLETILHDFKHNKFKLAKYNLKDCELVWRIFEKAKLLEFLIFRSHLTGLELDRAGGSVAAFTNLYLPQLHRNGYISPNLPKGGGLTSPGGYVMDSKPGFYTNVLVLDFKSLYPSIIRTFKIDPLGLIEGPKDPENSVEGFKGAVFHRETNLLPDIIKSLWRQRDQAKKQNDSAKSQAIKILMNSFYGVLGSGGCPFYDPRLASSITLRGHWIMKQTARWIEERGFEVIYGDTDSTFVLLGPEYSVEDSVEVGNLLQEFINTQWQLKLKQEYDLDCFLELEFETHFRRFIMPTIRGSEKGSKKRYAGLVGEGENKRVVFKGLENVRTDWTLLAREFQEKLYALVFNEQDPSQYILDIIQLVKSGRVDDKLVYRKRLRKKLVEYVKNVPPHVKAAKIADDFLQAKGRKKRYANKGWIKYVVTTSGPQPMENVTARLDYQHYIDKQITPIAEAVLPFIGLNFEQLVDEQLGLF